MFTEPQSTLAKVLKSRYFPNTPLIQAKPNNSSSYFLKGFIWGLELVRKGSRKMVGNGHSIKLFQDPWLPRPTSFKVLSSRDCEDESLVKEFITPSYQWNITRLKEYLCQDDVDLISNLAISPNAPDK